MAEEDLKVNDKRMFTADGELREEFRHLENAEPRSPDAREEREGGAEEPAGEPVPAESGPAQVDPPQPLEPAPEPAQEAPRELPPDGAPPSGEMSILDLVGLLAEHTALYLGEAELPDGQSVRDLRAAKLHLDLLDVLRSKTAGNLTAEETRVLEDILYRLRMLYVEKKRQEG